VYSSIYQPNYNTNLVYIKKLSVKSPSLSKMVISNLELISWSLCFDVWFLSFKLTQARLMWLHEEINHTRDMY
jgi:hypothetical protein